MGCGNSKATTKVSDNASTPARAETDEAKRPKEGEGQIARSPSVLPNANHAHDVSSGEEVTIIRLLLLGAAESGKTTLLEQIRLLYKQNFSEAEMFHRKAFIYNTILQSVRMLIRAMEEQGQEYGSPQNEEKARLMMEEEDTQYSLFSKDYADLLMSVWHDEGVQRLYLKRSSFNLNDSTKYFLDNFESINRADYVPAPKDIIMSYVPTIGVQNVVFTAINQCFQLFDIGGQRIDRRKWATMYDGIDAIFFCLAISEYDQTMREDMITNRLTDSLLLLQKISSEQQFDKTPIFLFLNEVDVFCEKLNEIPLQNFQDHYHGNSTEEALEYIERLAVEAMAGRDKSLYYIYRTVCVDTDQMAEVLSDVFENLRNSSCAV